mmetsp:Transcript_13918/g.21154  ORF Transcript_13918/g.21154 Transcript_13918/m.21154 type:complete len:81 (-) Transcript_13918:259-501(-)
MHCVKKRRTISTKGSNDDDDDNDIGDGNGNCNVDVDVDSDSSDNAAFFVPPRVYDDCFDDVVIVVWKKMQKCFFLLLDLM